MKTRRSDSHRPTTRRKTVWVMSELYYPEETSTGYFLTGIAEGLAQTHHVRVLCSQPTYSARGTRAPRRELRNGVDIHRCTGTTFNKDMLLFRCINVFSISLSLFAAVLSRLRRADIVMAVTNPVALPFLAYLACRLRGAKCLLLIHDVYPEALIAARMVRPGSVLPGIIRRFTSRLYRKVDQIIVLGRDMEKLVTEKLGGARKAIAVIPNWGDIVNIRPEPTLKDTVLRELGLCGKFVVQFCGNMGRTHGIENLVESASRLAGIGAIHFVFIGWGAKRQWLKEKVARDGLENVTILPPQDRAELTRSLNACDISIIPLVSGMAGISVPSRVYDVLAAGKPLIVAADESSELAMMVHEENIGWVVTPEQTEPLVKAILDAYAHPGALSDMGRRARVAAERKYSYASAMRKYYRSIDDLMHGPPSSGVRR